MFLFFFDQSHRMSARELTQTIGKNKIARLAQIHKHTALIHITQILHSVYIKKKSEQIYNIIIVWVVRHNDGTQRVKEYKQAFPFLLICFSIEVGV